MKRRNQILGIVLFTIIVACFCYMKNQSHGMNDLVFENIEALAGGESGHYTCMGHGSVSCDGAYVEVKIDGYRLGE